MQSLFADESQLEHANVRHETWKEVCYLGSSKNVLIVIFLVTVDGSLI